MKPLEGITVVTLEHAIAAPFCTRQLADLGARVIKVERPGSGRLRARLRQPRQGPGVALRLDQPRQGKPDARPQARRARRHPRATARARRRAGAEPRARRGGADGALARGAAPEAPAADRLRHLRLRRRPRAPGPVPRQEGVRPADPERIGLPVDHRHARRAGEGRLLDRRHRRRHVRVQQHPRRADRARPHRPRQAHRHLDAREHGRVDELSALLRLRRRAAAAAQRRRARDHLSLRAVPGRRRRHRHARPAERARVAGRSARACSSGPSSPPTRASPPTRRAPRRATTCARSSSRPSAR